VRPVPDGRTFAHVSDICARDHQFATFGEELRRILEELDCIN
jgi:hypothetical protein